MGKCEWCGKNVETLEIYTDAIGEIHNICSKCKEKVDSCLCRKCGVPTDPSMMINGLCMNCVQADIKERSKRKEEARLGVDSQLLESITFTDKDYEQWLTFGKTFSPSDMKSSKELKRIWIMVKFNASGIYDNSVISENLVAIETLLDRNFSKLIGNKCNIIIGNTSEQRKIVRNSEVIDYEDEVYILKA
jgi:hypothetical protein